MLGQIGGVVGWWKRSDSASSSHLASACTHPALLSHFHPHASAMSLKTVVAVALHSAAAVTSAIALILLYILGLRPHKQIGSGLFGVRPSHNFSYTTDKTQLACSTILDLHRAWHCYRIGFPVVLRYVLDKQPVVEILSIWMCAKALTSLADDGDYIEHGDLFLWAGVLMQALMVWAMAKALAVWVLQIYGWRKWWIVDLVRARLKRRRRMVENVARYQRMKTRDESFTVKRWLQEPSGNAEERDVAASPENPRAHDQDVREFF
jgi:hypothetical protein